LNVRSLPVSGLGDVVDFVDLLFVGADFTDRALVRQEKKRGLTGLPVLTPMFP
jgi:hypothetical protein